MDEYDEGKREIEVKYENASKNIDQLQEDAIKEAQRIAEETESGQKSGPKIVQTDEGAKDGQTKCPKCGAKVTGKFCTECGTKIED